MMDLHVKGLLKLSSFDFEKPYSYAYLKGRLFL